MSNGSKMSGRLQRLLVSDAKEFAKALSTSKDDAARQAAASELIRIAQELADLGLLERAKRACLKIIATPGVGKESELAEKTLLKLMEKVTLTGLPGFAGLMKIELERYKADSPMGKIIRQCLLALSDRVQKIGNKRLASDLCRAIAHHAPKTRESNRALNRLIAMRP